MLDRQFFQCGHDEVVGFPEGEAVGEVDGVGRLDDVVPVSSMRKFSISLEKGRLFPSLVLPSSLISFMAAAGRRRRRLCRRYASQNPGSSGSRRACSSD